MLFYSENNAVKLRELCRQTIRKVPPNYLGIICGLRKKMYLCSMEKQNKDEQYMRKALQEAEAAFDSLWITGILASN